MKKAVIITSIITVISLLATIGFSMAIAVSGVQMVVNSDYQDIPDVAEGILDIFENFVPGIDIADELREEIRNGASELEEEVKDGIENIAEGNIGLGALIMELSSEENYKHVILDKTFDLGELSDIDVNLDAGSVKIIKSETVDKAKISIKSKVNYPFWTEARCDAGAGGLKIKAKADTNLHNSLLVTIALPEKEYGKVDINLDAGNVLIDGLNADSYDINVDAGNIGVKDSKGNHIKTRVDAGNIYLDEGNRFAFNVKTEIDAGNISLKVPSDMGYTLNYDVDLGKAFLGDDIISGQGSTIKGDGALQINIKADMGSVSVKEY